MPSSLNLQEQISVPCTNCGKEPAKTHKCGNCGKCFCVDCTQEMEDSGISYNVCPHCYTWAI